MSVARSLILLGLGLMLVGLLTERRSAAAHGAAPVISAEYGENTEEVARIRYENNAARHWRYTMTRH